MIISNGQSEYISLYPTKTKIYVKYGSGATGTLTPMSGKKPGDNIPETLPNGDTTITGSTSFIVEGGGIFSFSASGVTGTITVEIDQGV